MIAEPVRLGNIRGTLSATGIVTTLPGASVTVFSPQPARIAEVTKNVGDAVTLGEILVRFEVPSMKAQTLVSETSVKAAELRVQQARMAQDRLKMLLDKGAASRTELDTADRELADAEGELLAARAAFTATQTQNQNTAIRAPFDGTVTERLHNPGDPVRADESDAILRLIDPKQVQVTVTVPVEATTRFTVGASARAIGQDRSVAELLRVISRPVPENNAKTVDVTLAFDSPTALPPGTQVGVEIDAEQRSNVALAPAIAVLKDDPTTAVVFVAAGNTAQRRPVVIGLVDAENIEILSGLKAGELIITQGHSTLRDGTPISVSQP